VFARVGAQDREAAAPLDERGEVCFTVNGPEGDEISFPVTEAVPFGDLRRALGNGVRLGDASGARLAPITRSALLPGHREQLPQVLALAFFAVDVLVDRLVADVPRSGAVPTQIAGDLLWRPSRLQTVHDISGQGQIPRNLVSPAPASRCLVIRKRREVAAEHRLVIQVPVALQLPINGRHVATELGRSLTNTSAGMPKLIETSPFVQIQMPIMAHTAKPSSG
jgi:hypothetical protein